MTLKFSTFFAATTVVLLASFAAAEASAATVRVKCEKRETRSKISVDGRDLKPGNYMAVVLSGDNEKASPLLPSVGDEIEFDFDSNRNNVAEGAIQISRSFIQGGRVTGQLLDEDGFTVAQATVRCRTQ
jgi:hypothetical protein